MNNKYVWNVKPRIITYSNPLKIKDDMELFDIIRKYPHLCASDTLMQGLIERYGRMSFQSICSIEKAMDVLLEKRLTNKSINLKMYVDISKKIENIPDESVKRAFKQNQNDIVDAFRLLVLSGFEFDGKYQYSDEQINFHKYIYTPDIVKEYADYFFNKLNSISINDYAAFIKSILVEDIEKFVNVESKGIDELSILLNNTINSENRKKSIIAKHFLDLLNEKECTNEKVIVIHGLLRFTPEILNFIKVLDRLGIQIIFVFNYNASLYEIYKIWDISYDWTGVTFENKAIFDVEKGRAPGRNISYVCKNRRVSDKSSAYFKEYDYLTDFTDGEVRKKFEKAISEVKRQFGENYNEKNINPLGYMETQYYAVNSDDANKVLKNYFPEQFSTKPFLSYPIGHFIVALYSMWDYENEDIVIDLNRLSEASVVRIGHNCDEMIEIINSLRIFLGDKIEWNDFEIRIKSLKNMIKDLSSTSDVDLRERMMRLSFFSLTNAQLDVFEKYVYVIRKLCFSIFKNGEEQDVNFRTHFSKTLDILNSDINEIYLGEKEIELIKMIKKSLEIESTNEIVGPKAELSNALSFFLSSKMEDNNAKWIVRGFEQLDGAPFMARPTTNRRYEITMLSMKDMTRKGNEYLPWPLDENILNNEAESNLFFQQLKISYDNRPLFMLFYLYYVSIYSEVPIIYSYIKESNDGKNRPYFVIDLMNNEKVQLTEYFHFNEQNKTKKVNAQLRSIKITTEDKEIYNVCPYKFFLKTVLGEKIIYSSKYQTDYYIKRDLQTNISQIIAEQDISYDDALEKQIGILRKYLLYLDNADIFDVKNYLIKNRFTYDGTPSELIKRRIRNFLFGKYVDQKTKRKVIAEANDVDILNYMDGDEMYASIEKMPPEDICRNCNFSLLCMRNHLYSNGVE